jgi:hypothetical protein
MSRATARASGEGLRGKGDSDVCNNGDYTTTNCPIAGNPSGLFIYQIKYSGGGTYNGLCVGDNSSSGYGRATATWSAATTPAIRERAAARPPSSSSGTATVAG